MKRYALYLLTLSFTSLYGKKCIEKEELLAIDQKTQVKNKPTSNGSSQKFSTKTNPMQAKTDQSEKISSQAKIKTETPNKEILRTDNKESPEPKKLAAVNAAAQSKEKKIDLPQGNSSTTQRDSGKATAFLAQKTSPTKEQPSIMVCNVIDKKMATYHYKWGMFSGEREATIKVKVDGTELEFYKPVKIPKKKTALVRYEYDFHTNIHPRAKGFYEYEVNIPQDGETFNLAFDWKKEENERIVISKTEQISTLTVP